MNGTILCAAIGVGILLSMAGPAGGDSVAVVKEPPARNEGTLYLPNRAPLAPSAMMKLPVGSVTPRGWLRRQLELDAAGLCGRLAEISSFLKYEGNGWVDPKGAAGWEEMPYWLRGYGDLGYVLKDEKIIAATRKWIDGIIAAQQPDGYFGPQRLRTAEKGQPDLWPHMLVLDAMHSWYEHTGDDRVIPFMLRYFKWQNTQAIASYRVGWGAVRWADNMAELYWLYNKTGEAWLLDLAKKIHENSPDYTTALPTWHNVNLAQGIREPAEYGMQSRDAKHVNATETNYRRIIDNWGQFPGGGFGGDENIRQAYRDPRQGLETCGYAEFMHTFEMMTRITASPLWADRCEDIAFNSFPAALTPDHKGMHYITPANCIQLDRQVKGDQFQNKFAMLHYEPGVHQYRCCSHNYGMGWPYYAEELWLATADRGLCASLYAASEVKAKVADGTEVSVTEETDYPFDQTVKLRIATAKAATFPLYLRIPRWCEGAAIKVNGKALEVKAAPLSYVAIDRTWSDGDTVELSLPMHLAVRTWEKNKNAVSVDYGPLTFALRIEEKWQRFGGTDDWPHYEVLPASPWNYGLVLEADAAKSFEIIRKGGAVAANPFTPDTAPIQLRAKAKKIPGWQPDRQNVVGVLQPSPVRSDEPTETIALIPMGAARLRITSFPTIGTGADAHDWTAPPPGPRASASHTFGGDSTDALSDGLAPASSSDHNIPRFTWWDHKGTTEWVQYDFDKPTTIAASSVYWFDDTGNGGCRVPRSWRLLHKDGDAWKPVADASEYATAVNRDNRVTFKTVTTSAIRLEAQLQANFSGGILEWKVENSK